METTRTLHIVALVLVSFSVMGGCAADDSDGPDAQEWAEDTCFPVADALCREAMRCGGTLRWGQADDTYMSADECQLSLHGPCLVGPVEEFLGLPICADDMVEQAAGACPSGYVVPESCALMKPER